MQKMKLVHWYASSGEEECKELHAQLLGIVAANDIDGKLESSWKIEEKQRMSFAAFRIRLSEQMIGYNLALNVRNSDEDRDQNHIDPSPEGVTLDHYKAALKHGRLCTTLEEIREHSASIYQDKGNNAAVCKVIVIVKLFLEIVE